MKSQKDKFKKRPARTMLYQAIACAIAAPGAMLLPVVPTYAQDAADSPLEEILVIAQKIAFAKSQTTKMMMNQKPPGGNVMDVVNNIPGVRVSQGAIFGSDDGSTSISMRGFSTGQNEQQIGMTIDGLPNGNSNYGGGSKANRFIDSSNLLYANVSQGTADISSPSHEALGGTIDFTTDNPRDEFGGHLKASVGTSEAGYYYGRVDTGEIFGNTRAYLSYSETRADSWIGNSGEMTRDHFEAKFITQLNDWTFTGRYSWDDADEFDMQRVSLESFKENPGWDLKVDDWVGVPYIDQAFRQSGRTIRENEFTWLKVEYDDSTVKADFTPYYHDMTGRGDWTPARINVVEGGSTIPGSGLSDNGPDTIFGGVKVSEFWYADADGSGNRAVLDTNCTETLYTANDGVSAPKRNPACYPEGSIPVMSYRHTHYAKERIGFTVNVGMEIFSGNTVRTGIWYEEADRDEARDVHEIIDPLVSNKFFKDSYWVQYDRNFITDNVMLYLEDTYETGDWIFQGGIKQFYVDLDRTDNFGIQDDFSLNSDSDVLFSLGGVYTLNDEVEIFAGFSQGFAPIKTDTIESLTGNPEDTTLDISAEEALDQLEGETTDNFEIGFRYRSGWIDGAVTVYSIEFDNRITSVKPVSPDGFVLSDDDDIFINVGGVESQGVEASVTLDVWDNWSIYSSITFNDATYSETKGDIIKDNEVALSPKFQFVSTVAYTRNKFDAGISGKYAGEHYGDFANEEELPSSYVVDLWAGYTFDVGSNEVRVDLNWTNIFDEKYLSGGSPRRYNIGVGRQFMGSVAYVF